MPKTRSRTAPSEPDATRAPVPPAPASPRPGPPPGPDPASPPEEQAEALEGLESLDPASAATSGRIRRGEGESRLAFDRRWREQVHAEGVAQLTLRAVLTGSLIGAFLGVSNLYVGLKSGWTMGVAITACVLSTALWRGLRRLGLPGRPMGVLEQNCMQSTASAAGYPTSSILITAIPAWALLGGGELSTVTLMLWTGLLMTLGLALALPFKRQLLHYEELPWPSSVAAAQTLRTLHARGEKAVQQAQKLFASAALAGVLRWAMGASFPWWRLPLLPEVLGVGGRWAGLPLSQWTFGLDVGPVVVGAGAILGLRVGVSLLLGSALAFLGVAPWLHTQGLLPEVGFGSMLMRFSLWGGASLMLTASLFSLALQWRVLWRGVGGLRSLWSRADEHRDPLADLEVPARVGAPAALLLSGAIAVVGQWVFGIPWWVSLVGVGLGLIATLVAARAAAETDIMPMGSLGKVSQLSYGALRPADVGANLLGTSIVTTSAASGTDLLTNLKCGWLLGANPRRQVVAQGLGILVGAMTVVPVYRLLVPDVSALGEGGFPAPAAQAWRAVAEVLAQGIGGLEPTARLALSVGALVGILLSLLGHFAPKVARWTPSPVALGMGMVIPFSMSAGFLLGAGGAALVARRSTDDSVVAVSSGLIAGDSMVGVLLAILLAAA